MRIKIGDESWPLVARSDITMDELGALWVEAGLGIRDVMSGDLTNDPRLLRAFVWLARRRDGEFSLNYGDVDFKYADLGFETEPGDEAEAAAGNPTGATQDGSGNAPSSD